MRHHLQQPLYRSLRALYRRFKDPLKPIIRRHERLHRLALTVRDSLKGALRPESSASHGHGAPPFLAEQGGVADAGRRGPSGGTLPDWLVHEWREIHAIEPQVFPDFSIPVEVVTDYIAPSKVGQHYLDLYPLFGEQVSHVILTPWLKKGGAELVTLNLVKALVSEDLATGVVVVTTETDDSPWADRLPAGVRVIEYGKFSRHLKEDEQEKLLVRVLLQMAPPVIHTINSLLGYSMFINHGKALASQSRLYASAFCEDITPEGRSVGYPICFLPRCFDVLTAVLTDNSSIVDKLCCIFAFDRVKFHVHYQPIEMLSRMKHEPGRDDKDHMDIVWASRLDIQKRPDILIGVAEACHAAGLPFTFHVHGTPVYGTSQRDSDFFVSVLRELPNVRYYGGFEGLFSLPVDQHDLFLYTSQWDGLPNVILEALSLGLPVMASKTGGIPEVIIDGETGFLVDPFDDVGAYVTRLRQIYRDRSLQTTVVEKADELLQRSHSWRSYVDELMRIPGYVRRPEGHKQRA